MDGEELFQRYDAAKQHFSRVDLREASIFLKDLKDAIFIALLLFRYALRLSGRGRCAKTSL